MTDAATTVPATAATRPLSLASRLTAVIFSPYKAYADVAARPKVLGALVVSLAVLVATQVWFLSSEVGQQALLDQQVGAMEAFGVTVSDQMYDQMEQSLRFAPYTTAAYLIIVMPLVYAVIAGLVVALFTAVMGGSASFKHAFAVVAHASFIPAIASLVTTPLNYVRADMSSPLRLNALLPMLDEESAAGMFLGSIDLLVIWWVVSLAIGVGVLYQRRTSPITWAFMGVYLAIVVAITGIRLVF